MSRLKADETKKKIFGARFEQRFQKWLKEESGRKEESFRHYKINGKEVFDPSISRQTLNNWRNGSSIPQPINRPAICQIFGVSEDFFDLDHLTHDELYNYVSVFITKVGKENVQYATQEGLNLKFVEALSKIVEFDEKFPVYAPINNIKGNSIQGYTFSRSKPDNSAQIDHDLQFLQVQQDGKTITMSRGDLMYLKEVQDEIADYVKYLFYKRKLEMVKEVEQFNEDLTDDDFDENGHVKPEFVLKHDRFAIAFEDVNSNQKEGE